MEPTRIYMPKPYWDDMMASSDLFTAAAPDDGMFTIKVDPDQMGATTLPWENQERPRPSSKVRARKKAKRKQTQASRRRNR